MNAERSSFELAVEISGEKRQALEEAQNEFDCRKQDEHDDLIDYRQKVTDGLLDLS